MKTQRVRFENVGRNKMSWEADVPRPMTVHGLIRSIKKHGALMSRDIDFSWDDEVGAGTIMVGFRAVGTCCVVEDES